MGCQYIQSVCNIIVLPILMRILVPAMVTVIIGSCQHHHQHHHIVVFSTQLWIAGSSTIHPLCENVRMNSCHSVMVNNFRPGCGRIGDAVPA